MVDGGWLMVDGGWLIVRGGFRYICYNFKKGDVLGVKKIIITIFVIFLFAGCKQNSVDSYKYESNITKSSSSEHNSTKADINKTLKLFPIDLNKLFSAKNCSLIITKSSYKTCYDYGLKSLKFNAYELDGELVNAKDSIENRPDFYEEEAIPKEYRASYWDYAGYDRGHMRSDASSDYDLEVLKETYSLGANIVAQYSGLNRYVWSDVEIYSRQVAVKKGLLNVINIAIYGKPIKRNRNNLAVPSGFYKILYTGSGDSDDFKECYYYKNRQYDKDKEQYIDTHEDYMVDCAKIESVVSSE